MEISILGEYVHLILGFGVCPASNTIPRGDGQGGSTDLQGWGGPAIGADPPPRVWRVGRLRMPAMGGLIPAGFRGAENQKWTYLGGWISDSKNDENIGLGW